MPGRVKTSTKQTPNKPFKQQNTVGCYCIASTKHSGTATELLGQIEAECRDDNGDKLGYKVKLYGHDKVYMLAKESVMHSYVSKFEDKVQCLKKEKRKQGTSRLVPRLTSRTFGGVHQCCRRRLGRRLLPSGMVHGISTYQP